MDVEGDIDRSDLILLLLLSLLLLSMHIFHYYLIQASNQPRCNVDYFVFRGRGGFLSERHYLLTNTLKIK